MELPGYVFLIVGRGEVYDDVKGSRCTSYWFQCYVPPTLSEYSVIRTQYPPEDPCIAASDECTSVADVSHLSYRLLMARGAACARDSRRFYSRPLAK